jgi:UDP-glucose 4-epimerase
VTSAFVTGAHGFIGRHLSRELAHRGFRVAGLGHGSWPESEAEQWGVCRWLNGTVDSANLDVLVRQSQPPDVVFHLAGGSSVGASLANPREDFLRTVTTTSELMEWLRQNSPQTPVVLVSSAAVYGNGHDWPVSETAFLNPYSPYGVHKRMMEEVGESYSSNFGLKVVVVRLFSVFGLQLRKQLLWDLCTRLATGTSSVLLGGSGSELRDWTAVSDVVHALIGSSQLADAGCTVLNIGTGTGTSVRTVAEYVSSSWHHQGGQSSVLQFSGKSRPGDPLRLVADSSKLDDLGLSCRQPLEASLNDYVRWYRSLIGVTV